MANTNTPRYSLDNFDKLPDWLKRSWHIYKRASIRSEFKEFIKALHASISSGNLEPTSKLFAIQLIGLQEKFGLGQGMNKLLTELIINPDAPDEVLINLIPPPMRFINYGTGEIRPSDNPKAEFIQNEQLDILYLERRGSLLSRSPLLTYLTIPPGTSKQELKDFIDEYFDTEVQSVDSASLLFPSERHSKQRIHEVSQDEIIDERILELRANGIRPKDIAPLLATEFGREFEPFEIQQRLNQAKRRKHRP